MMALLLVVTMAALLHLLGRRQGVGAGYGQQVPGSGGQARQDFCRIGIYNIHRGKGLDGRRDLGRIAKVLGAMDVVGLCEVQGAVWPWQQNQARRLAGLLGLGGLYAPCQRRWFSDDRGNGLLFRPALRRWYREPLPDSTGTHPRCLLSAEVEVAGLPLTVMVTHLARRRDQRIQLETVLARFMAQPRAVLMGDFNVPAAYPLLQHFLQTHPQVDAVRLARVENPQGRIEWILARGVDVLDGGMAPAGPSDHPFYWVSVRPRRAATVLPLPAPAEPVAAARQAY
ncbi:endonuclease/exonuclease/phosphatase [Alcanivorax hongdengensis A-11-3]|uniref:Endonuclease/exonuclease/phosphatase n=1 Tax=Alcanivorax hongdengensis A-11-3 TaxID=1177179 RepID=L0WFC1_9GAMM|nr:endonuclease/exonuclease/phosphatase family protein [Alcanivorax hongdengensis]EKF74505.1 endonuclease/exonuclease/phosphatase [Alcanivorax hongdengensis A-11-3]